MNCSDCGRAIVTERGGQVQLITRGAQIDLVKGHVRLKCRHCARWQQAPNNAAVKALVLSLRPASPKKLPGNQ